METKFKKGMKFLLRLPKIFPGWISKSWEQQISFWNGKIITLRDDAKSGKDQSWPDSRTHSLYFAPFVDLGGAGWCVCTDWLENLNSKQPCDCSLSLIIARG